MNFRDNEEEVTFRILNGDTGCTQNLESLVEVYTKSKNDYVRRITGWKRAETQKHNWRKYRYSYRAGLKRFHRNEKSAKIRDKVLNSLLGGVRVLRGKNEGKGDCPDSVLIHFDDYNKWEFLASLLRLECDVVKESAYFDMEEDHADQVLLSECVIKSMGRITEAIVDELPISMEDFELLLCLLGEDLLKEREVLGGELLETMAYSDLYIDSNIKQPCLSEAPV